MIDNEESSTEVLDYEQDVDELAVVDNAFIMKLIDSLVNDHVAEEFTPLYGKPLHKALFLFSAEHAQDTLECMVEYALNEAGISKEPSFEIVSNGIRLFIDNAHPHKEIIEEILNGDSKIAQTFSRMSGSYTRIASFYRYEEFSKAYAVNPRDAVEKYRDIFDNKYRGKFSIFVSNKGYEPKLVM